MRISLDNEHKNILGKNVRKLRKERKLTQKDLAAKIQTIGLDMDRLAIVRIEAGTRVIADYFDVSLDYIFCRTGEPQGKLCDYRPEALKEQTAKDEELRQFVDMCFDPNSPMSGRLKEMLVNMLRGESQ